MITETKDPKVWGYLMPYFIPTEEQFEMGVELCQRMMETPDDTYVSIVVEDNRVMAFLVCYVINETDVLVFQARANPALNGGREVFDKMVEWSKSKGKTRIVAFTERNPLAIARKYGFVEVGSMMIKEI